MGDALDHWTAKHRAFDVVVDEVRLAEGLKLRTVVIVTRTPGRALMAVNWCDCVLPERRWEADGELGRRLCREKLAWWLEDKEGSKPCHAASSP